jgi:hypothetical protein
MKVLGFVYCVSFLCSPFLAASRKRKVSGNVHQLGSLQKRSRPHAQAVVDEKNEEALSVPKPLEVDFPLVTPIEVLSVIPEEARTTPIWRKFQDNLKVITLNGQEMAATLSEKESFFFDLPYVDSVIPSMQAGEQFFVPVFLQNVLLPVWLGRRGPLTDNERAVLKLSRRFLYLAMADYIKTVLMAAVLQMKYPLKMKEIRTNSTNDLLSTYIYEFFGVSIFDKLGVDEWTPETVKEWVAGNLEELPSLVLIGKQWGFDDVRIANNILRMKCLDRKYLESLNIPLNGHTALFLRVISQGLNKLSNLKELTVNSVAWTINPTFTFKRDPVQSHQTVVPQEIYEMRPALSPLSPLDHASSWRDLLTTLKAKEAQGNPTDIPSWPENEPNVSSESLVKEKLSDKSSGKKVKFLNAFEKKEKIPKGQQEVVDVPKKKNGRRPNRLTRTNGKDGVLATSPRVPEVTADAHSPQTIELHDQAIGFNLVEQMDMSHPAWYSPQRSDDLFPCSSNSSSTEVWSPCGEDSNGKEEDQEDFLSMFLEDPMNLFDDTYGFRISSHPNLDLLSSDCEFD